MGPRYYKSVGMFFLALFRSLNKYVYFFQIVESLTPSNSSQDLIGKLVFRWDLICMYFLAEFLSSDILSPLWDYLWLPVRMNTERSIEVYLIGHLHSLSMHWHVKRKTGEVLRLIDRGTGSLNHVLGYVV